jgi:hypothetical protein
MSCWLRLISDVPLDWFLRSIIGSCGFREATAEELAAHHAKTVASFEERNPQGTTETERLAYEIQRKRELGYLPGACYLMTSPAPAVDSDLPTDWLYVRESCNKTRVDFDGNPHRWPLEHVDMAQRLYDAIRASGFSAGLYDEDEPQFWGAETPEEIADFERTGPCGEQIGPFAVWWKNVDGHEWKLVRDRHGVWGLYLPAIAELVTALPKTNEVKNSWLRELGHDPSTATIRYFRGNADTPFRVPAHDSFAEETRPLLIEYYKTGVNPFEPRTSEYVWANWLKQQIDLDPGLVLDEGRRAELEATWKEAWRTTSVAVNRETGEVLSGSLDPFDGPTVQ